MMISKHLKNRQIQAVNKIGDCLLPGEGSFPSFSQSHAVQHCDRVLDYMPKQDLEDLKVLLTILSFFPKWILTIVFWKLEFSWNYRLPMPAVLRLIRIGIRGLIMSLYYSGGKPYQVIGYQVGVYLGDQN